MSSQNAAICEVLLFHLLFIDFYRSALLPLWQIYFGDTNYFSHTISLRMCCLSCGLFNTIALPPWSKLLLKGGGGGTLRSSLYVIYLTLAHKITQMGCQGLNPSSLSVSQSATVVPTWSCNPERKTSLFRWKCFTELWKKIWKRGEKAASKGIKYYLKVQRHRGKRK